MRKQNMNCDFMVIVCILFEVLFYMQCYFGVVVVVKFGGNVMGDDVVMVEFVSDIVLMKQVGIYLVVVYGGGLMINDLLQKLGIESNFVCGKCVIICDMVEVVEMVLFGLVNKCIVQVINDVGGCVVGILGKDDDMMVCEVDDFELGFVGCLVEMNVQIICDFYNVGLIFVIVFVVMGMVDNEMFNVNGDMVVGVIVGVLKVDCLLLLIDVLGVKDGMGEVVIQMYFDQVCVMIVDGIIVGGMIFKIEIVLKVVDEGVCVVVILDGCVFNVMLLELFIEYGVGLLICMIEFWVKLYGLCQGVSEF